MFNLTPVLEKFVDRLTDNYNKNPDSNVMKLAKLTTDYIQGNQDTYDKIAEWRDIDQAEGAALDLLGADVAQYRGQAQDDVYRIMIKSKIKRNLSDGSINTIIDFMSFLLRIDASEVHITEEYPAALHIEVPADAAFKTGLTLNQFGTLVDMVVAGGVRTGVLFKGSFFFAEGPGVFSPDGFSNIEQTNGGTLGKVYDPANDYELPF